jgi:hypothetical protein
MSKTKRTGTTTKLDYNISLIFLTKNPHRKVGVFYCATTNYSTARATCDFVWKRVYDTFIGVGEPRQNYQQDDR